MLDGKGHLQNEKLIPLWFSHTDQSIPYVQESAKPKKSYQKHPFMFIKEQILTAQETEHAHFCHIN